MTDLTELADRLESFIPRGDGYNSDYANTLAEAVEVLRAKAAPAEVPYALRQWAMDDEPESTLFDEGYNAARRWVKMQLEKPAEPFQKPTLLKECNVRYSDSSGGVCRSEYKGGTEQTTEPTEAVEVVAWRTNRDEDSTFPRLHKSEAEAHSLVAICNNGPRITKEPLMTVAQHKRLMANHSADDLNMVNVSKELIARVLEHAEFVSGAAGDAEDELRALLGQK